MNTLVSVIVVTFNSSEFVEETLNSILTQTWHQIELIITDDCSTDDTLDICRKWLLNQERRFVHTEIITVQKNTGVTANFNRGINIAKGEWIKFISGDDVLLSNCIEDNLRNVSNNPDIKVQFSYCRMYLDNTTEDCFIRLNPTKYPSNIINDEITPDEQYKLLLLSNRIPFTPSCFFHHDTFRKNCKLDESLAFSEDYQLWLSFTKKGIKLFFLEKETVKYRMHDQSLSKQKEDYILNPVYFKTEDSIKKLSYPHLPWDLRCSRLFSWNVNQIFRLDFFNRKTRLNKLLYYVLNRLLNPFHYFVSVKSNICKKYKNDIFYK